jgi:hypothetical protein
MWRTDIDDQVRHEDDALDHPMRVFISWSGEPSRSIALVLSRWLKRVLPSVRPWMSEEEIPSGARWNDELGKALEKMNFGIVCVTRANQTDPWPMFEAGALAKMMETARVVPLCIDLSPKDLESPLAQYQGQALDEPGMRRLVHDLNKETDKPLARDQLDKTFKLEWPDLANVIAGVPKTVPAESGIQRSTEDRLRKLKKRVRRIERDSPNPPDRPKKNSSQIYPATSVDKGSKAKPIRLPGTGAPRPTLKEPPPTEDPT